MSKSDLNDADERPIFFDVPVRRWSTLATHVMEAFRPFWGRIALPAHWAERHGLTENEYSASLSLRF